MTYYVRYVLTEAKEITLPQLEAGLQEVNAGYSIDGDLLVLDDEEFGQIDILRRGTPLFEGDLETLQRYAAKKSSKDSLLATLQEAQSIVTVQVIWSLDDEETLSIIDPLFYWLLDNRRGIVVVEGGFFFAKDGPVE